MVEEEQTVHKISRVDWPSGPWDKEPEDRVDFEHAGFACLLLRNSLGSWCGYVGVGPDHPLHGKDYESGNVNVHGGLTYAASCQGPICHVPKPGMPADVWWLGFDCAHSGDIVPGMLATELRHNWTHIELPYESYKTVEYARAETVRLVEQLRLTNTSANL